MNRKPYPQGRRAWRWTAALAFVLLVVVLAACLPFGGDGPEPETTAIPTWNLETATAATATAESTPTLETTAVSDVTATATATATTEPAAGEPPEVGNVGTPPADGCVVAWPGPGAAPSYVYAAPATSAEIIGRLGVQRWAQVVATQGGWFEIFIGPGETGWVQASAMAQNEHCGEDPGPGVPVVDNSGSPPDGACSVAPADGVSMVNVRSGPGLEHGRIAVLASWAEVSNSEDGWHQIAIGDGDFGWVSGSVVDLSGPCEADPERIQFETGATSTTIEGQLDQPYRHFYVFRANAGQRLAIVVHSDTGQANFGVSGLEDGQPYKRVENESRDWWIVLPTTQDYRLTIAAAGPVHYQLTMEITDVPASPEPTRITFPPGSTTEMVWGRVEPDEQDLYVFRALAGQTGVVDVNSSSSPLFAMVGVDSGEVLKPMSTERMWEGTFPETQDYLVRIVGGESAADYELIIGIDPLESVAPIYDHFTGYLLGGVQDNRWVDVGTTVAALSGGETYRVYTGSGLAGTATGSAPEKRGGVCPGTILSLSPAPEIEMSLGFGGDWDPAPRTPAIGDGTAVHRDAVASLLAQHGVDVDPIEVNVAQVWTVDVDNDGHAEEIIQAARLKDGGATPAVDAGDYAVIAMMKQTDNGLRTVAVAINAFPEAQDLAYPWRYYVPNILDLDGDGRLELVVSGARFEGAQTTVYVVDGDGTVRPVMSGGCAL